MPVRVSHAIRRRNGERGTAMVEFVVCFSVLWIPLFFGLATFGFQIVRGIQVTQVSREAGHLYALGTDFTQTAGQTLLGGIAVGMDLSSTGNAKVILSTVTYIAASDCQAGGLQADSQHCPNYQTYVFTRRVVVPSSGGVTFHSAFGNLTGVTLDSAGGVSTADQLKNAGAQLTTNFQTYTGIASQSTAQFTYVSEMYANALSPIFWSSYRSPGAVSRSYF